jgi:hypothetical protein
MTARTPIEADARKKFLYDFKAGPAGGRLRRPSSAGEPSKEDTTGATVTYSRTFSNERIRVSDIKDFGIISDALFSECTIVGPAVLLIMDSTAQLATNVFAATVTVQVS